MRSPAKHALFGCMFVYQSLSNLLGGNSKVKNSFLSIQIQTRCEYSAANNYFFLEGRMSDQVTILIGHSRKLVGHDSTYRPVSWRLKQAFWLEKVCLSTSKKRC